MPFGDHVIDGENGSGAHSLHRISGKSQLPCHGIGFEKTDTVDILCQPVGIGTNHFNGTFTVTAHKFLAISGGESQALQKDHILPVFPGIFPCFNDAFSLLPADFGHFAKPSGVKIKNTDRLFPEMLDYGRSSFRSDAPDPVTQEAFNPGNG